MSGLKIELDNLDAIIEVHRDELDEKIVQINTEIQQLQTSVSQQTQSRQQQQ